MENVSELFSQFARKTSNWSGRPLAFALALAMIVVWAMTGPMFHFGETWQLVINTGTTIITFLMVFLLQNAQARDTCAIQTKLDELILKNRSADNRFVGLEKLSDQELAKLEDRVIAAASKRQVKRSTAKSPAVKRAKAKQAA